jgi:hypothetical protein
MGGPCGWRLVRRRIVGCGSAICRLDMPAGRILIGSGLDRGEPSERGVGSARGKWGGIRERHGDSSRGHMGDP